MAGINKVYFDSCIFLAYLKGENDFPAEMLKIKDAVLHMEAGLLTVITSTIFMIEVLEATLTDDQNARVRKWASRREHFSLIDANYEVCKVAGEIRNHYKAHPIDAAHPHRIPSTPDCIHVASAIAAKAISGEEIPLWTLDCKDKKSEIAMVKMTGKVAGKYLLEITLPK